MDKINGVHNAFEEISYRIGGPRGVEFEFEINMQVQVRMGIAVARVNFKNGDREWKCMRKRYIRWN